MIVLLFVFTFLSFMFSSFTLSYQLSTINRVVIYTPIEIFEKSISLINLDENHTLSFDKNLLRANLKNYYDENLHDVFKNYILDLYYYNQNNGSICTGSKCDAVEVTVRGTYMYSFSYSRSIKYEIHKGAAYGQ